MEDVIAFKFSTQYIQALETAIFLSTAEFPIEGHIYVTDSE